MRIATTLFILFFVLVKCFSQNPVHKQYTINDGLPSMEVYNILQDKHGFIWIVISKCALRFDVNSLNSIQDFILIMKKNKFHLEKTSLYRGLIGLLIIVWLLTTASTDGIIGRTLYEYGQYFKLITWGTMLLIVPLFLAKPNLKLRSGNFKKLPERSHEQT